MEDTAADSSLDRFLNKVTTNVLQYAMEKVVEVSESIDIDENSLLEQLNDDLSDDSLTNDTLAAEADFEEIKNDTQDIDNVAIHARCCQLIEDSLAEAYTEVKTVLEAERLEIAAEAEASERRLRLLHCIKNSQHIQNLFQNTSVNIVQDALAKVRNEIRQRGRTFESTGCEIEYMIEEDLHENNESDSLANINQKQGNNAINNIYHSDTPADSSSIQALLHMDTKNNRTVSLNDTFGENSTAQSSFYSLPNESHISKKEYTDETLSSNIGFMTANSEMFETADEQHDFSELESSPGGFMSFNDEESIRTDHNVQLDDTPREIEAGNELDKTLTESQGPRQSTPLGESQEMNSIMFPAESSHISVFDSFQVGTDMKETVNNAEHALEVFTDEDSSSCDLSSPGTLSRQSSAFGNVTLEFDHEWESGIHSFPDNSKSGPNLEEKHTVVLHELSFDERADLKAPDLLGPVFLAIQEEDEDIKKKHKLSQSIDDLCEMISDDEDETELPLRRRAMSLETKKPQPAKTQHVKVPTKDELIRAFQELRDEIMEDKDLDVEVDDEIQGEVVMDDKEQGEVEMDDEEQGEIEVDDKEQGKVEMDDKLVGEIQVDDKEHEEVEVNGEEQGEVEVNDEEQGEVEMEVYEDDEKEINKQDELEMKQEGEMEEEDEMGGMNTTEVSSEGRNVEEPEADRPDDDDPLRWQTVVFNGQHKVIDLKLLEPYLKVLTHGGYHNKDGKKAVIVVLTACNLPDKKMKRYPFIMEQLFFFLVSTMDILITSDEYIFVYFHGGADKNQAPSFSWFKKYYQYINRRLRKSVTNVYVVHPNLWLKSVYRLSRPFLSSNFSRKLKFVSSLKELSKFVQTDFIYIPDEVIRIDPDYKKVHAC